jgi:hypothetical protein
MTLPNEVYSPDQLSAITMELRAYIGAKHDAARRSDHGGALEPAVSSALRSIIDSAGNSSADQLLSDMEQLLKSAPTIHVITAAKPNSTLKQQITNWFRTEIHPSAMLTFAERRDLGGGVIVRAGSHIYDFSFKRKILDNKHRITELAFGAPAPVAKPAPTARQGTANNVR